MIRARVLGIPHIEDGEIRFAVWVQRPDVQPAVVQVSVPERNVVFVESQNHANEVIDAAREEVLRWAEFQDRFMDRLFARLDKDKRRPIQSHVRETAARQADSPVCALCRGSGESEKFVDRSEGATRWSFAPKMSDLPFRERGSFVPCPSCRRIAYDQAVERTVNADSLAGELERVEAIVNGRIATIREKIKSFAPPARAAAVRGARPRRSR